MNADQVWSMQLREVLAHGRCGPSRDGDMCEVIGLGSRIDPRQSFLINPIRKLDPAYASAELLWYLSGSNDIAMIKAYAPQYARFGNAQGITHGAYGPRVFHMFSGILRELVNVNSRRAVIGIWNQEDLDAAIFENDVPCTLAWQFMIRGNQLYMVTYMRSNDMWLGWPYDVHVNCCIMYLLAAWLKVDLGFYTHLVGSQHIYERNNMKAREASSWHYSEQDEHGWKSTVTHSIEFEIKHAVKLEAQARLGIIHPDSMLAWLDDLLLLNTDVLHDSVLCAASKWLPFDRGLICSPIMRKAVLDADSRRG